MAEGTFDGTLANFIGSDNGCSSGHCTSDPSVVSSASSSRLNARAPEFVPQPGNRKGSPSPPMMLIRSPVPIPVFPSPGPRFRVVQPEFVSPPPNCGQFSCYNGHAEETLLLTSDLDNGHAKGDLSEEIISKIVNQVEYYFSDVNLATTDHLMRFISKDPEGYVPVPVVAGFKKIRALVTDHSLLADALRSSSKLVVSEDGKKVRRQNPFTDADMMELQSRIIVAENLPEDHSHQKLMKIFSSIGSVKSIRTCPAQPSNGTTSVTARTGKTDMFFSNKLHAFVEYETSELAEKAVAELNDDKNWSGLRVRRLLTCLNVRSGRGRKVGRDGNLNEEDDDASTSEQLVEKQAEDLPTSDSMPENLVEELAEKDNNGGRSRGRGRGRGRGRSQYYNNRGHVTGSPAWGAVSQNDHPPAVKQPPGPRMPDGTRGFALGRGKPANTTVS